MKILRIVLFLLVIAAAGAVGYVYITGVVPPFLAKVPGIKQITTLKTNPRIASSFSSAKIPQMPNNTNEQLQTFGTRASEVTQQAGTVLGTAVQKASGSGSIQDRAFEYGRYLYCQQVVKDYEAKNK